MESCSFCGNKNINKSFTEYTYKKDDAYLIVKNVPCQQCEFCGEKYFETKVLKQVEYEFLSIQQGKKIKNEILVPVEEFNKLQVA